MGLHLKTISANSKFLFALLMFFCLSGLAVVSAQESTEPAALAPGYMLILFFILVVIIWVLALLRKTVGMSLLSGLSWFALMYALFIAGDTSNGLTVGFSIVCTLLGVIMVMLAIYQGFELLRQEAEAKQRKIVEEVL